MSCSIIRDKNTNEILSVLASNGNESILFNSILSLPEINNDKEQALKTWAIVYTDNFKNWFGDWENNKDNSSKILDENGEPLLVYHASTNKFEEFKKDKISDSEKWNDNESFLDKLKFIFKKPSSYGFFFTKDLSYVNDNKKNIYPVFLNIQKPLTALEDEASKFWSTVKDNSFDGAVWNDNIEIIAYEPNQIKSLFNEGQFSLDNNIYKSKELNLENKQNSTIDNLIEKFYSTQEENTSLSKDLINSFNNRKDDTIDVTERKIELLKQALNAEVIVDASIPESGQLLPANHPLSKKYNKPVIVINPNKLFSDTVIHEFGHLYIDLLKEDDGVLNQAYELLRGTSFANQISKQYPELSGLDLDKEILATALGIEGDKIFQNSLAKLTAWQKIKNYILSKLKSIFNINENAIEKLAGELLSGNVRLSGAETYNTLITQRSKYVIEENSNNKQSDVVNLLDQIQKDFTKEEVDGERYYKDKEGNIYNNSVTNYAKGHKRNYKSYDKRDRELIFDSTLYTKENILFQLMAPKIPESLAKSLNDLLNDRITTTSYTKRIEDKNWYDAFKNESDLEQEVNPLAEDLANLEAKANNTQPGSITFSGNIIKHFDKIIERANEYQERFNQAPIVGNMIHNALENYVRYSTPFPENITDTDNKLLNNIKSIIDSGTSKGSIFKTEQILYSENRQIPGTADLIEITKDGEVIIYDYKTTNSFEGYNSGQKTKYKKTDEELYFDTGYAAQILSYGAILQQYNITLADDPYHIITAEMKYFNVEDENSSVEVVSVRNKSLSDENLISSLNNKKVSIFRDFASNTQLADIKIKAELKDLNDLSNKINNDINTYKKLVKNLNTNLDDSFIEKIKRDLEKEMDLENSIEKYKAKNNEVIIKSYVNNIHDALALLETQKDILGEIISSEYLQSLNYLLQSTSTLEDIKRILEETSNKEDEISVEDKFNLIKLINQTLDEVNNNKEYYKQKVTKSAIANLAENSNLMQGLYKEKFALEAKKQGLKGEQKDKYVEDKLRSNRDLVKIKELNYWTKQYQDGFADLRFLEYLVADPGMSKSQFVQLVKNILDKSDNSTRNKVMEAVTDIDRWFDKLTQKKTGDPKEIWDKFLERKTINNKTKLAGSVIPEFTSKYREVYLKYENKIKEDYKVLKKLKTEKQTLDNKIKQAEVNANIKKLAQDRFKEIKDSRVKDDEFDESYIHPEFNKLSKEEQENLRFIHKNLLEADDRLYASPEKKLVKALEDGTYIFYLPRERRSNIEALANGTLKDTYISKIKDLVRPPADEDELNLEEFNREDNTFGTANLDIYGNESFSIPVYYRNELEDEELQSYDIPSLLASNHETTIFYQEHKLVEADLFVIQESISSKNNAKILKTDSFINKKIQDGVGKQFQKSDDNLVYQAVKSSIDNRLYKRAYKGVYSKGNYQLIKGAEAVSRYASTLVLAGNFMSGLATFSQGSIYRLLEASVGEHITMESWKQGTKKAWLDFPNMLKDTQKQVAQSKSNLLIKKFGLETQAHALVNKFVQDNFAKKQLDQGTLFSVTSMAEAVVTSTLMYSLLGSIKVTNSKGEYINKDNEIVSKNEAMGLDEAYKVVDGKLVLNNNVKYTSFNITEKYFDGANKDNTIAATEVSRYIRSIYADMYGQYNQDMKSVLQRTIWGKLAMSLRGWLPRGVHRRWRGVTDLVGKDFMSFDELRDESNLDKRFYSQDQKQFQEGHYTTSLRFLRSLMKEMKQNQLSLSNARNNIKSTMTDHEIANLKRTQYEIGVMLITFALAMMLRVIALNSGGDDKEKEKIYFAAYLASRINTELATFISPSSMMEMLSNPAASMSVIKRVFEWMWQLMGFSYSAGEGFTLNALEEYESGPKQDNNKALIQTFGLVPGYAKTQQIKSILGLESKNSMKDTFEYTVNN